ncbi:MAG: hypothetical protein ISR64_09835 [Deltaproteobacteria bacterium]|nr:hypothetical protein [Deltaproteobacteria bacterium]
MTSVKTVRRKSRRKPGEGREDGDCPYCGRRVDFLWTCPCGFCMCQSCMNDNLWGVTCNNITWECPDCDRIRSY